MFFSIYFKQKEVDRFCSDSPQSVFMLRRISMWSNFESFMILNLCLALLKRAENYNPSCNQSLCNTTFSPLSLSLSLSLSESIAVYPLNMFYKNILNYEQCYTARTKINKLKVPY